MIGVLTRSGTGSDVLDMVHDRCAGEILRVDDVGKGGETDYLAAGHVRPRDMKRLRAAGLVSNTRGCRADVLAHVAGWTGTADEFLTWYVETCIQGLKARAESREGRAWHELERPVDDEPADVAPEYGAPADVLPEPVCEYLMRLVHGPKADYASAYAYHVVHGHPAPDDPGTEWAIKARRKVDALVRRGGAS